MPFAIFMIFLLTWWKTHDAVHKFQLSGYYEGPYLDWYLKTPSRIFRPYELFLVLGVFLAALAPQLWLKVLGLALIALDAYFFHLIRSAYPQKKKLAYTARVKRMMATTFILSALLSALTWTVYSAMPAFGAVMAVLIYALAFFWLYLANGINTPIERAINTHYLNDAKRLLEQSPHLKVIGITGSYGKTSTKNVLNAMLSKDFNTLMSPASFNTPMGLTKTIRSDLKPIHQVFIAEMGAKKVGEIKELCDLVHPSIGIITSIGPQHLETFKTFENIVSTKGELFKYLKSGGTAIVNAADENIVRLPRRDDLNYVTFSVNPDDGNHTPLDYTIESVSVSGEGSSFTLVHVPSGKRVRLTTRLLGRHNLSNVLAGAVTAIVLGVPMKRLGALISDLEPIEHRLSYRRVNDKYTILDDAFNSNPVGSKMALGVLAAFNGKKKYVITPGMIELGDRAYELNKSFGTAIADACDYVILVGRHQTEPIQDGLKEAGYPSDQIFIADSIGTAFSHLHERVADGDVVLIENDLPDTFNEKERV